MRKFFISLVFLLLPVFVFSQDILSGVYVKDTIIKSMRFYPGNSVFEKQFAESKATSQRFTLKIKKDGKRKEELTIFMDNSLSDIWFPVYGMHFIEDSIELKQVLREVYYSKAIKHPAFSNMVFYSPAFDLDSKIKNTDSKLSALSKVISSRFYFNNGYKRISSPYEIDPIMYLDYKLIKNRIDFLQSFYFKKNEVTNAEYREFTDWVKDSTAMEYLVSYGFDKFKIKTSNGKYVLNWKMRDKIWEMESEEAFEALRPMYLPAKEMFYRTKGINTEMLFYDGITIYPDTTVWMSDYTFSYSEPYLKKYYWHKNYEDYPVVGVNWYQAQAFCNWKTKMIQRELDESKLPYKVVVDLPREYEREYVITKYANDEKADQSYLSTLMYKNEPIKSALGDGVLWNRTYTFGKNGYLYTHPADVSKNKDKKKYNGKDFSIEEKKLLWSDLSDNGVSGLKSNVSEWMQEDWVENWHPVLHMRSEMYHWIDYKHYFKLLDEFDKSTVSKNDYKSLSKDIEKLRLYYTNIYFFRNHFEMTFERFVDKSGRLVRGSNWYDETCERMEIENAKTFVSPNDSYSTIGFRYVIHVYPKEK